MSLAAPYKKAARQINARSLGLYTTLITTVRPNRNELGRVAAPD